MRTEDQDYASQLGRRSITNRPLEQRNVAEARDLLR
jgi:hypothetical protein